MKLTDALEAKFNDQITLELQAAHVYRQLSIAADSQDLPGVASWMRAQAEEELVHAQKFIDHVVDRDNDAVIGALEAPGLSSDLSPQQIFKAALDHEQKVSESIRKLYRATEEAGDLESRPLLLWFIDEQVEEEATVSEVLGKLDRVGNDGAGVLRIDAELGSRHADLDTED
ncbi:MAG: ferritin [Micrococcaceae bacterium]